MWNQSERYKYVYMKLSCILRNVWMEDTRMKDSAIVPKDTMEFIVMQVIFK